MEDLHIVDHHEWWITYESKLHPEEHGIYVKYNNEASARTGLGFARDRYTHRIFECQRITVHRSAEKLDW